MVRTTTVTGPSIVPILIFIQRLHCRNFGNIARGRRSAVNFPLSRRRRELPTVVTEAWTQILVDELDILVEEQIKESCGSLPLSRGLLTRTTLYTVIDRLFHYSFRSSTATVYGFSLNRETFYKIYRYLRFSKTSGVLP
jgi:hypothetical protein